VSVLYMFSEREHFILLKQTSRHFRITFLRMTNTIFFQKGKFNHDEKEILIRTL
jgi:hypothetical protein